MVTAQKRPRSKPKSKAGVTPAQIAEQLRGYHPAVWLAQYHHRTHEGHRFDLVSYPYLRQPLDDPAQVIVVKKSTQGGWTEMLIIKAMAAVVLKGLSVFWALPTDVVKSRFVKNRFDRSVAYTRIYQDARRGEETQVSRFNPAASMSLKHFGAGALAFVGSNSISGFGEFPADIGIDDEHDYCDQDNLPMIEERLSNSEYRLRWMVGNPTISGFGISALYADSTQGRWRILGDCGHWVAPEWKLHVVREVDPLTFEVRDPDWEGPDGPDARVMCDMCGKAINRYSLGEWELRRPDSRAHGYHVNKLFSTHMTVNEMLERFNAGLLNPGKAQRFWNGDMGEAYTAAGAHVGREDLESALGGHPQGRTSGGPCFIGVDVGAVLHVVIGEEVRDGTMRVVCLSTLPGSKTKDLRDFCQQYPNYKGAVIDALPETRFSRRMAFGSRRWMMCTYGGGKRDMLDMKARTVSVNRTAALDAVVEALRLGTLKLPADALGVPDFEQHMGALTRVHDPEANGGEGAYVWQGDGADHYFHALGYMLLARRMMAMR